MIAHGLVLLERHLDPVHAVGVAALTEELGLHGLESLGRLGDAFVHRTEERLVPGNFSTGGHVRVQRRSPR